VRTLLEQIGKLTSQRAISHLLNIDYEAAPLCVLRLFQTALRSASERYDSTEEDTITLHINMAERLSQSIVDKRLKTAYVLCGLK
jgi:hypothetical protein